MLAALLGTALGYALIFAFIYWIIWIICFVIFHPIRTISIIFNTIGIILIVGIILLLIF